MTTKVTEGKSHNRIEIDCENDNHLSFNITVTEKGIEIVANYDNGDMVVKPKMSNHFTVTIVPDARI